MRRTPLDLDPLDRRILNALQDGFPLVPEPFAAVAAGLGIDADALVARLVRLKDAGAITRFGPFFDAEALGGAFCLCAMAVPPERFDAVAARVNAHPEVAHNYARDHALNMWFVLATETPEAIARAADAIAAETGLAVLRLPKLQEFFIGFRVAA
jgi:DNA-binding Lrp family transcriptional regulator